GVSASSTGSTEDSGAPASGLGMAGGSARSSQAASAKAEISAKGKTSLVFIVKIPRKAHMGRPGGASSRGNEDRAAMFPQGRDAECRANRRGRSFDRGGRQTIERP